MDHYTTLGVSRNATQDEIKKAFRTLAMQHHPDKGGDLAKFQEITNAYETLSDANKRAAYDRPAANPFGQHPGNPFGNFGVFDQFDFNEGFIPVFCGQFYYLLCHSRSRAVYYSAWCVVVAA